MLLLTDVHYFESGGARAAGVLLRDWPDDTAAGEVVAPIEQVAPYVAGSFYRRELPCLLALLQRLEAPPRLVVVDGYVRLGPELGLGARLHEAIALPVVGVAKNPYPDSGATPVRRGTSETPLWVSAIGLPTATACAQVRAMAGPHRMPTMLTRVDRLARDGV